MSIASCLGSLANTGNLAGTQTNNNQLSTQSTNQTGLRSPTNNSSTLVMNNSSSLSNGSNGLDLGAFTFGSSANASSLSPTDNRSSVIGSGLTSTNNNNASNNQLNGNSNGSPSSFTKCILCNQQYGSPKVMPCCFRTYCLACLEKLQQHQQIKCPGCSSEIHLNDNGVSSLHTDYSIIRILEQINEINNGLTNGTMNGTNNNLKELTCSKHNDELLRYYCKICDQATCKECISFQHQKHDNEYLIDASNKFIDHLYTVLNEGKSKCNELGLTLKSIEHNSSKLQIHYNKAQNDIQETYMFFINQLEQQKNLQLKELEDSYNSKFLTLSLLNSKVHDAVDKMSQIRQFLDRYKKFKCNLELIQFKQLIEMRLMQIKHFEPELNMPKVDLEFVCNYQAIQTGIKQNFGYIKNSESVKQPPISRPNCGLNYQHHSFDGSLLSNKNSNSSNSSNNNSSNNSSCSPAATGSSLLNGFSSNGNGLNGNSAINSLAAAMTNLNSNLNSTNSTISISNSGSLCNNNLLQENIANLYEKWSMGCGSGGSPDSGLFTNSTSISDPLLDLSSSKLSSISNMTNGTTLNNLVNAHQQQSQLPVGMVSQLAQQQLLPIKSQVKRQKMIYHCKFGEFGVMEGQFTEPSGVAVNAQNDVIVADTNNHRIQIFDKEGRFKFQFGECGKKDGQLLYPNRVAVVKQSGDLIVTERSPTHQIQIYNQYGQFVRKFGANILQHPRGVTVDNKGRIIVVECKVMRVLIFDQMGNVLQKFGCSKHLEFPNGVVVNDRQEIFISDNRAHCVKVFSYEGQFLRQIGGEGLTNYPIGVCINESGEILVADNHNNFNITVFTQTGQLLNALESKVKHAQCFDVALMDDNSVVLASKDYRIYVYRYLQLQSLAQAVATSGLC